MITTMPNNAELTTAQRKKLLIAQGVMYRAGLTEAKNAVRANLQTDVLVKGSLSSLVTAASGALGHGFSLRNFREANFQTLLPLLISGVSLLVKKRSLIQPLSAVAVALTTAAAIAGFMFKKPKR
jgi:hypothetical protein